MLILIGSRALAIRNPGVLKRDPLDFDFIALEDEAMAMIDTLRPSKVYWASENKLIAEGQVPCEFEIARDGSSAQLLMDMVEKDPLTINIGKFGLVPSFDLLFALKASHRYLKDSPHFWKTAGDYHRMKAAGARIRDEHLQFFALREKETYTYKHPNLNVKKSEFFDHDQVKYVYDHDSIHEAVKHLDRPAYSYFIADGAQVRVSKEKFFACPKHTQLLSIVEESYVLSLERSQIPHPGVLSPSQSYGLALSKVCSSITSGWWREFAYENIWNAVSMYSEDYMHKFQEGLKKGIIKPYDK